MTGNRAGEPGSELVRSGANATFKPAAKPKAQYAGGLSGRRAHRDIAVVASNRDSAGMAVGDDDERTMMFPLGRTPHSRNLVAAARVVGVGEGGGGTDGGSHTAPRYAGMRRGWLRGSL